MMARNIQGVSDSYLCCNCGACLEACPHEAIEFKWSGVGRLYAQVNDRCTDCGICQKVCPSLDLCGIHKVLADEFVGEIRKVYVGKSLDSAIFQNAQSGGVATSCIRYLLDKGLVDAALLCRMDFGETPKVSPFVVTSVEQLGATQGSCYTPVSLLAALGEVRKFESVAIVGLPCHLQGLWALSRFSRRYGNIKYRIGLICDRTECAGMQDVIKDYCRFNKFKVKWKGKYNPTTGVFDYKSAPLVAISDEGEGKVLPRNYRLGLKDMFTPPRCMVCPDKLASFADVTLGDPWELKGVDHVKGENLILARSEVGLDLLRSMEEDGYVALNIRTMDDLQRSQHIDLRRARVADYSAGFSILPNYVNSHLLSSPSGGGSTGARMERAKSVLADFIKLEQMSKTEILSKAREEIARYEKKSAKKKSLMGKALRLLKRFFHGRKG